MNIINKLKKLFLSNEDYLRSLGVEIGPHSWISTREFPSEGYLIKIATMYALLVALHSTPMAVCGVSGFITMTLILSILVRLRWVTTLLSVPIV